ncbi:PucR family transcriptional regulator [Streptomyces sp. NPDC048248]|uniref:PucR family transcriptional regulator n=1 Tax=Streptomyces sp. NPDC048248 TaxID=3365523 RepID=UPI003720A368
MFEGRGEGEILRLAMAAVPRLGPCRPEACYRLQNGRFHLEAVPSLETRSSRVPLEVPAAEEQLSKLGGKDGPIQFPEDVWGWATALRCDGGLVGYLVVSAESPLSDDERFLIYALAQPIGAALDNAASRRRERERTWQLAKASEEREATNERLTALVAELEWQRTVHEVLTRSSVIGEGVEGIANAVNDLTGLPTCVADPFGNVLAQAGPGQDEADCKPAPLQREQLLHRAVRELSPVRDRNQLVALAQHHGEVLGTIALIDPASTAGPAEEFVLEHACTALALELAHRRHVAEVELRLRRELVDDLIGDPNGPGGDAVYSRAEAVGHDLHGPHHVAVVQWQDPTPDDRFMMAVGRAAQSLGLRSLLARRSEMAVLVTKGEPNGAALYEAVADELESHRGAVGIGGQCEGTDDLPRSFDQSIQALRVRLRSQPPYGATSFAQLGLYRILAKNGEGQEVDQFVRDWLAPLLDYDKEHGADLVLTLTQFFDCGGNYDRTARALAIHRSTLRYRLQRIREVSGRELSDVDDRFNLHIATRIWKVSGPTPR